MSEFGNKARSSAPVSTLWRVPDYSGRVGFRAGGRQFGEYFPGIVRRCFPDRLVWKENTDEAGFQRAPTAQAGRTLGSVWRLARFRGTYCAGSESSGECAEGFRSEGLFLRVRGR